MESRKPQEATEGDDRRRRAQEPADAGERPLARAALDRRKRRDTAVALPLAGIALFASPLLDLMAGGGSLLGIPLAMIYVFGIWFLLILATARLARLLIDDGGDA